MDNNHITPLDVRAGDAAHREMADYELREAIGKTEDINAPLCMHSAIVAREMAQKGVTVCRVCNKPLPDGVGRINDHLVLRHPDCVQPICTTCSQERPDEFHKAFQRGIAKMEANKTQGKRGIFSRLDNIFDGAKADAERAEVFSHLCNLSIDVIQTQSEIIVALLHTKHNGAYDYRIASRITDEALNKYTTDVNTLKAAAEKYKHALRGGE